MKNKVELTALAVADISDILAYTLQRYGETQCAVYSDQITKAIQTIALKPDIGHFRPDIPPAYRAFGCQQHIIVYQSRGNQIFIARLLHGSMDFRRHM